MVQEGVVIRVVGKFGTCTLAKYNVNLLVQQAQKCHEEICEKDSFLKMLKLFSTFPSDNFTYTLGKLRFPKIIGSHLFILTSFIGIIISLLSVFTV